MAILTLQRRARSLGQFSPWGGVASLQFPQTREGCPIFAGRQVSRLLRMCRKVLTVLRRYIAVTHGSHVQVWRTPNHLVREFAPFVLHRTYTGHHDDVLSVWWSPDSQCFITTSRDMTARLFTLNPVEGFRPKTFAGHRDVVLGAFFSADGTSVSEFLAARAAG